MPCMHSPAAPTPLARPFNPIAQLLAAAGIVLRAARWANAVAGMPTTPRGAQNTTWNEHQPQSPQQQQQPQQQQPPPQPQQRREREREFPDGERDTETETPTRSGVEEADGRAGVDGGGGGGVRSRHWRARDSVLLNASGTRVPPAAVASLGEAELEVCMYFYICYSLPRRRVCPVL